MLAVDRFPERNQITLGGAPNKAAISAKSAVLRNDRKAFAFA